VLRSIPHSSQEKYAVFLDEFRIFPEEISLPFVAKSRAGEQTVHRGFFDANLKTVFDDWHHQSVAGCGDGLQLCVATTGGFKLGGFKLG
jgi:hypothetical protein